MVEISGCMPDFLKSIKMEVPGDEFYISTTSGFLNSDLINPKTRT